MKEGYIAYVVSAKPHGQPDHDELVLDNLDGHGLALTDLMSARVATFHGRTAPEKRAKYQSAYTFTSSDVWEPGSLYIAGESGPYGRRGRLKDIDGGDEHPIHTKDATLIPQRAAVIVPEGARFGLLFCERRGVSTLRSELEEALFDDVARANKLKFTIEAHLDYDAWDQFLEHAQVATVRAVYPSKRDEDYLPQISSRSDLTLEIAGGLAHRAGTSLIGQIVTAVKNRAAPTPGAYLVADLRPSDEDAYSEPTITVVAESQGIKRTIRFTETGVPQWIYETGERLTAEQARQTWSVQAPSLLSPYLKE